MNKYIVPLEVMKQAIEAAKAGWGEADNDSGNYDVCWRAAIEAAFTVLLGAQELSVFLCNGYVFRSREGAEYYLNSGDRADNSIIPLYTAAPSVPDGWQLVPKKHTLDMGIAFAEVWYSKKRAIDDHDMHDAYDALLAAAPKPTSEPVSDHYKSETHDQCESGCGPATHYDGDGIPLCDACWNALPPDLQVGGE